MKYIIIIILMLAGTSAMAQQGDVPHLKERIEQAGENIAVGGALIGTGGLLGVAGGSMAGIGAIAAITPLVIAGAVISGVGVPLMVAGGFAIAAGGRRLLGKGGNLFREMKRQDRQREKEAKGD